MDIAVPVLFIIGSYLLGAIPTSYWLARILRGIDIRQYGSGNVGISNFATHVGRRWGVPVVLFDVIGKGALPVLLASDKVFDLGIEIEVIAATVAIIGHNWSIFVGFAGGRGMATVLGASGALSFPLVVLYGAVPAAGVLFTPWKDSAVWWGVAALLLPVWALILHFTLEVDPAVTWFCVSFIFITAAKRISSDNHRLSAGAERLPLRKRLLNRLVFDRDIASREEWVRRRPAA